MVRNRWKKIWQIAYLWWNHVLQYLFRESNNVSKRSSILVKQTSIICFRCQEHLTCDFNWRFPLRNIVFQVK